MKEREISLIDLLFEILLKWRKIIVATVIGGILLGGYSYLQSTKTANVQNNQGDNTASKNVTLEEVENKLTHTQRSNVRAVLGYEEYSEYFENSILMQIDANNVPTVELIFCIKTTDSKVKNIVVETYTQLISTGMTEWLIQKGESADEAAKVRELITVENEGRNYKIVYETGDSGSVYVSVVHKDEEKCKALASHVKDFVEAQKSTVNKAYGEHEVTLVSETYATVVDSDLLTKQRTILINATSGNTSADKLMQAFTPQEKQYYDMLKGNINSEVAEGTAAVPVVVVSPSISIKYVILGMVLFAFVYVFYVFMAYIFNNKLRANDDIAELYEIPQLGIISKTNKKKKFLGFIDAWIIALRDRNKRKFTEEEAKEIVAVAIKMAVKKSDSKDVCLIGCDVKKQIEDICGSIKVLLEKEGIKVSVLDNVLYNAEEMEKLSDAGNAVIIEKTGATMYDEVAKELELLKRYNINILGGVLVD